MDKEKEFRQELESVINRYSMEAGSGTPDFILADYLRDCLSAFDKATRSREQWYGFAPADGQPIGDTASVTAVPSKPSVEDKVLSALESLAQVCEEHGVMMSYTKTGITVIYGDNVFNMGFPESGSDLISMLRKPQ